MITPSQVLTFFRKANPVKTHKVLPKPKPVGVQALEVARTQIGTKESPPGTNRTKYGQWYGLNGQPWCSIFVSWCFVNSGYLGFKYAYVPAVAQAALEGLGGLRVTSDPQQGDIVTYTTAEGPNMHIAFFDEWADAGHTEFFDVGGNTGQGIDVQSNGGEVIRQLRRRSSVTHFIHIKA